MNPSKTTADKIFNDGMKNEGVVFVRGINCTPEFAKAQMQETKNRFNKNTGNVGYHIIQSFDDNEGTNEQVFEIGCRLAEELFGDKFEVIVALHKNTDNLHNHFCQGENEFFVSVIELLSPSIHRKPPGKNPRRQAVMFAYLILTLLTALHAE